ncbi:MAG: aldo/keto reductase [Erysipelotrichaceae bacterium]|nr:aldo/keto reductase [Erysipelotrichaceae bacterium]
MKTIEELTGTKKKLSKIFLGTGSFGGSTPVEKARIVLDAYYEKGGRMIDTAVVYCDWYAGERSKSEKLLGEWMDANGIREELFIHAKGCHIGYDADGRPFTRPRLKAQDIKEDILKSLKNLKTDYLDVFTLHMDDPDTPVNEIIDTLQEEKQAGRILAYGCSNWTTERIMEAENYAKESGKDGFILNQVGWSLNSHDPGADHEHLYMDEAMYQYHKQSRLPVMAYTASGKGYFQKRAEGREIPEKYRDLYNVKENDIILKALMEMAKEENVSVNELVLYYLLLDHGFQVKPIISCRNTDQLEDAMKAEQIEISDRNKEILMNLKKF